MKENGKLKKILLGIVAVLFVLIILVIIFNKLNNNVSSIILRYSASSEYLDDTGDKDIVEIEITGDDFDKIKALLKDVKRNDCDCAYTKEALLIINNEYSITVGKGGIGRKIKLNVATTTGNLVSIPDELYNLVKKIIEKQGEISLFEDENQSDLTDYEFDMNSNNKFVITTDMRWKTMRNDGGSNDSIYYQIDLENKVVVKIEEDYYANLGGTPRTEKSILYTKKLSDELAEETEKIIDDIIDKEDINDENNYYFFTIESLNYKKDIYFNSCVYKSECDNFLPEFMVIGIEKSADIDGKLIAKYTLRNYFFSKKNNKGFKYQTFYFYDKIDKYVIGQKLRLK